ncbi:MAG: ATP-dependent DNA helicase [Betaproteobacteria bacterium]|nr:ATP-dependent DNA helicase [Betaproteobacteria bacterium]
MSPLKELFAETGPISRSGPGYRFRPGQLALAEAISETLNQKQTLLAEAGTGVGKTFAYLVPLMLTSGKSIVSTATRHLQDQLYERDLPRIKSALGVSIQTAVLKGRGNYLCLYRMERAKEQGRFLRPEDTHAFSEIVSFSGLTSTGDIAECSAVPEHSPVWAMATSTRENCLGQQCPKLSECFVMAARQRAAEADLLIVNHHLLCADMALRDEGFGEILPSVDHVVIDEAHTLPEIATEFFSQSISTQTLSGLARDSLAIGLEHARDAASWPDLCGGLERSIMEMRALLVDGTDREASSRANFPQGRMGWDQLSASDEQRWIVALKALGDSLSALREVLSLNADRHAEIAQLAAFSLELNQRLAAFQETTPAALDVRWIEFSRYGMSLRRTPFEIAARFQQEMGRQPRSWIMLSATLAIAGRFDHFQRRLGLHDASTLIAESPFDFQRQGLLLVPQVLPDPKSADHISQLLHQAAIKKLLESVRGGVFILCTSHRAVGLAARWAEMWAASHPHRLILVQGQAPRPVLIEQFRSHGAALLIGSHSFWEGVDVPGDALSLVVIDKLPFAPPDDPVLRARSKWCEAQGADAFAAIQVPEAAILLKQGVGRLIRSESDRGVVVIGDRRLAETGYGRRMLRSLPNFSRTRDPEDALQWLASNVQGGRAATAHRGSPELES